MKRLPVFVGLLYAIFLWSCEEEKKDPAITTNSITGLSGSSYYVKATILEKGSYPIKDYGFIYYIGTSENYYPGNQTTVSLGSSVKADTFSTILQIQSSDYYSSDKLIYARAYLTNEKGTVYAKAVAAKLLKMEATSVSPAYGKAGDTLTISGKNFDNVAVNNSVTFNSIPAVVVSATSTRLKVIVPAGISLDYYSTSILIKVKTGFSTVDLSNQFVLMPSPTSFSPNHGTWNNTITIYGSAMNNCTVYFNDIPYTIGSSYNSSSITVQVPTNVNTKTFRLYIEKFGKKVEVPGDAFTMDNLKVTSFSPGKCLPGSTVTLYGNTFHPSSARNKVYIGQQRITPTYTYNGLQFTVPVTQAEGKHNLYVSNGIDSLALPDPLEVLIPVVTSISPDSGYANSKFTITGRNFFVSSGTYAYFGSQSTWCSVQDSSILKGTVPTVEPGPYKISFNIGNINLKASFKILSPVLTSINPATGTANSAVIINGKGFGTSTGNVSVYFGSLSATPMSITDTQINVKVPSGVTSGKWMVTVKVNGYTLPETLSFEVP